MIIIIIIIIIPHVRILGTNYCGEMRRTAFKQGELFQDVLCRRDYYERVVASFAHQIQSEYYGGNISVSIEGISLEHFSTLPKSGTNTTKPASQHHAVFHSFLSDDIKQYSETTTAHSKRLISLLKEIKLLRASFSTIWENNDGCAEKYRCASALYLMSVMFQCYSFIIDQVISAPGHVK